MKQFAELEPGLTSRNIALFNGDVNRVMTDAAVICGHLAASLDGTNATTIRMLGAKPMPLIGKRFVAVVNGAARMTNGDAIDDNTGSLFYDRLGKYELKACS